MNDHITRGFIANGHDGSWHPDSAKRIGEGNATAHDILNHIDTKSAGTFWHHPDQGDVNDAKEYASQDADDHPYHDLEYRPKNPIGSVGVVLEGKKPEGWHPDDNSPGGKAHDPEQYRDEGGDLMGHSSLPSGTHIPLHKIHYTDANNDWHSIDASSHHVTASNDWESRKDPSDMIKEGFPKGWNVISDHPTHVLVSAPTHEVKRTLANQGFLWRSHHDIDELTNSMKENGFDHNHPINVHPRIGISDGHHRLEAAGRAGIERVPLAFHKTNESSDKQHDADSSYGADSFYSSDRKKHADEQEYQKHIQSPEYKERVNNRQRQHHQRSIDFLEGAATRLHGEGNHELAEQAQSEADQHRDEMSKISRFTPNKRVFSHTDGMDHRLFEADGHLRPDARAYILDSVDNWWTPMYGPSWKDWSIVYFAGSEASEWTSTNLEGNSDFDVLIGVDYKKARKDVPIFAHMNNQQITDLLNNGFKLGLNNSNTYINLDGIKTGPWDRTTYVNPDSYDIRKIKPYAAYDVSSDRWVVKPPHLPHWSVDDLPKPVVRELRAVEAYVKAVLKLPEPMKTQQGAALFEHLHSDRSRAFSNNGEGWYDPANLIEKWLDQSGLWAQLVQCAHNWNNGMGEAPSNWDNSHPFGLTISKRNDNYAGEESFTPRREILGSYREASQWLLELEAKQEYLRIRSVQHGENTNSTSPRLGVQNIRGGDSEWDDSGAYLSYNGSQLPRRSDLSSQGVRQLEGTLDLINQGREYQTGQEDSGSNSYNSLSSRSSVYSGEYMDLQQHEIMQNMQQRAQASVSSLKWITTNIVMGNSTSGLLKSKSVGSLYEAMQAIENGYVAVIPPNSWTLARKIMVNMGIPLMEAQNRLELMRQNPLGDSHHAAVAKIRPLKLKAAAAINHLRNVEL